MTKDTVWRQTSIWLFSALMSAMIPYAILLLLHLFSNLREYSLFGREYHPPLFIGSCQPFEGISQTFTMSVYFSYGLIGLILSLNAFKLKHGWRLFISKIMLHLAIASLFLIIPLLSTLWALAIDGGEIYRVLPWGVSEGNHGPWRYAYNLRMLLYYVFQVPMPVFVFGIVSLAIKPSRLAAIVTVSSVIAWYALIWSHYWLID